MRTHIHRTHIHIDTELMATVMQTGQFKTKREAVEAGLQVLIHRKARRTEQTTGKAVA
ncbi:MAG: type II toxin-antitoxin system VapB family antitoxin [Pseudomonadota bacterium]|nr:type II toxin-antitoxin system VapB family antitoxin [Pseudomonadota bacterium]